MTQIGSWALGNFAKDQTRIELFLKLTRKNLNALSDFPLVPAFAPEFKKFCDSFAKLEKEYRSGIPDRSVWANGMLKWGTVLTQSVKFI